MKRSLLILAAGFVRHAFPMRRAPRTGFIVVERPFLGAGPGHFPFAPLEVTSHHVEGK